MNKGGKKKEFVLYTGFSDVIDNKLVKHVNEFLSTYGKGGYYKNAHRPKFEEFTDELKERALKAIDLGNKRKKYGYTQPTMEHIKEIGDKVQMLRNKGELD